MSVLRETHSGRTSLHVIEKDVWSVCVWGGGGGLRVSHTRRTLDIQVIINMLEKMDGFMTEFICDSKIAGHIIICRYICPLQRFIMVAWPCS